MSSIFGIAVSGLNATRASLTTTGHNISGVNTAGYHRQVNGQASNMANYTGAGYIGNGVQTTSISLPDRRAERSRKLPAKSA